MTQTHTGVNQHNWEALAEVWERYRPRFYQKAFRYLGCREDAEDALQDALLCAARGIGHFRGESHLSTWLYSIVINSARSILRRQLRREIRSLDDHSDETENLTFADLLVDSAPGQEEVFASVELRETFDQFVQQLPATQGEVCKLRALRALSIQEIAENLGIPEGTVKTHLARGRAKLMRMFAESGSRVCAPQWEISRVSA